MKSRHITEILDAKSFDALAGDDLEKIKNHAEICAACRKAFRAARMSAALFKKVSKNAPAPNAFFQAKVLNAWRERQTLENAKFAFRRWWQASAAMVFAMILIAAVSISLSAVAPVYNASEARTAPPDYNLYSTDAIILEPQTPRDLTNEEALEALEDSNANPEK